MLFLTKVIHSQTNIARTLNWILTQEIISSKFYYSVFCVTPKKLTKTPIPVSQWCSCWNWCSVKCKDWTPAARVSGQYVENFIKHLCYRSSCAWKEKTRSSGHSSHRTDTPRIQWKWNKMEYMWSREVVSIYTAVPYRSGISPPTSFVLVGQLLDELVSLEWGRGGWRDGGRRRERQDKGKGRQRVQTSLTVPSHPVTTGLQEAN